MTMPICNELSPLLQRLWGNVWRRLPATDRRYIEQFNLVVEQFTGYREHSGRFAWQAEELVISLAAYIPDGLVGHYVIAHELAHVRLNHPGIAWGNWYLGWAEVLEAPVHEATELLADVQVWHWGFEQELLAAMRANRVHNPDFEKWLLHYPAR